MNLFRKPAADRQQDPDMVADTLAARALDRTVPALRRPSFDNNRWQPREDELAVFLTAETLNGTFGRCLRIGNGAIGYLFDSQGGVELPAGEHVVESLPERLNGLLQAAHCEILLARTSAVPVRLSFANLRSIDFRHLSADIAVRVAVDDFQTFCMTFMTSVGVITSALLEHQLAGRIRQTLFEFVCLKRLEALIAGDQAALRESVYEALCRGVSSSLRKMGLKIEDLETVRFGASDDDADALDLIKRRGDHELEETRLTEDERSYALIRRRVDLYEKVSTARSRMEAIDRLSKAELEGLEAELRTGQRAQAKRAQDDAEADAQWESLRALAEIERKRAEDLARAASKRMCEHAEKQAQHELERTQAAHASELAKIRRDEEVQDAHHKGVVRNIERAVSSSDAINEAATHAMVDKIMFDQRFESIEAVMGLLNRHASDPELANIVLRRAIEVAFPGTARSSEQPPSKGSPFGVPPTASSEGTAPDWLEQALSPFPNGERRVSAAFRLRPSGIALVGDLYALEIELTTPGYLTVLGVCRAGDASGTYQVAQWYPNELKPGVRLGVGKYAVPGNLCPIRSIKFDRPGTEEVLIFYADNTMPALSETGLGGAVIDSMRIREFLATLEVHGDVSMVRARILVQSAM